MRLGIAEPSKETRPSEEYVLKPFHKDNQKEVADASSADDEAEIEVKADKESTEAAKELSDDTPPEDTNEEDK